MDFRTTEELSAAAERASSALLGWYARERRVLPWRSDPTPYHVWISEIMLQQTRVAAVLDYYARFLAELPDVQALAEAEEERLMKLWQGLGYYNRARNLQKAAKVITERYGGRFPDTFEEIRALPGVGDYTAGAIASIAFGLPYPAVDGNVLRVIARLAGDEGDIADPRTKERVRSALLNVMPKGRSGEFNQALMELGAVICLPNGAPLCEKCPVRELCAAYREDETDFLPVKAAKKPRRVEERIVYLVFCENRVALRKRPAKGLLAGLWEYPNALIEEEIPALDGIPRTDGVSGRHIFSHVQWEMRSAILEWNGGALPEGWVWATADDLENRYAIPGAFAAFVETVRERLKNSD